MARPCRIYPLGANTELADTESGKLYKAVVTETGSGASANIGKITTITSEPGAGVFDDVSGFKDSKWHHIAIVIDDTDYKLFLDGIVLVVPVSHACHLGGTEDPSGLLL